MKVFVYMYVLKVFIPKLDFLLSEKCFFKNNLKPLRSIVCKSPVFHSLQMNRLKCVLTRLTGYKHPRISSVYCQKVQISGQDFRANQKNKIKSLRKWSKLISFPWPGYIVTDQNIYFFLTNIYLFKRVFLNLWTWIGYQVKIKYSFISFEIHRLILSSFD